jgi:RNA polymerase sigma-70 factor (ECF subfamily)
VSAETDFAEFYSRTFASLTTQLHAFVGNHAEAQDLVQEAFCRAYSQWSRISEFDDPVTWVRRVAWNMAISHWRRTVILRRWQRDLVAEPVAAPSAMRVDLARALAQLPRNQRQVIILHYLADMPVAEIAEFVGAAEGTVKAWLHRARGSLSTLLGRGVAVSDV